MKTTRKIRHEAKQLLRLCVVNGSLDEDRVRQVVQRVLESKRRGSFALATHFQRLVRLDRSRHAATVESATPLTPDLKANVQAGLEQIYGSRIIISFAESPALIGGMRIQVGSDVYDGSLRAALTALEKSF
jgi:F-type H+-transporting ATPase subunit delta